ARTPHLSGGGRNGRALLGRRREPAVPHRRLSATGAGFDERCGRPDARLRTPRGPLWPVVDGDRGGRARLGAACGPGGARRPPRGSGGRRGGGNAARPLARRGWTGGAAAELVAQAAAFFNAATCVDEGGSRVSVRGRPSATFPATVSASIHVP